MCHSHIIHASRAATRSALQSSFFGSSKQFFLLFRATLQFSTEALLLLIKAAHLTLQAAPSAHQTNSFNPPASSSHSLPYISLNIAPNASPPPVVSFNHCSIE